MSKEKEYFETNQKLWDAKTGIHIKSDFYDVDSFLNGKTSLTKIELAELPDLTGKKILHSQCHFGQDTLSLQRMGGRCTGIDLSPVAIEQARAYNDQLGLEAKFVVSNVLELDKVLTDTYDMVYNSYGVIGWLPDLKKWAHQLMKRLKPGGIFYLAEFHPTLYMYDFEKHEIAYDYFNLGEPIVEYEEGTYADKDSDIKLKEYFWQHSLEEVIMSLISEGLVIDSFKEYEFSPYPIFSKEDKRAEQEYLFTVNGHNLPLVFSIKGTKKQGII